MSNIADPSVFINYISEYKKIFVTSSGAPISQMFKIDSEIDDFYYFKIINSRNQTVSLHNRSFQIYGSYIDSRSKQHILFHNSSYGIEDNVLIFQINTYTDKYLEYVTNNKTINITIVETTNPITQVILRDKAIAYPRPYIDGKTIQQIVEYEILTGLTVPVQGSFGAGYDINLVQGANTFAFGRGLITANDYQTVLGTWNYPDSEQIFIVGNGYNSDNRSNLFTINQYGEAYLSGNRVLTNLDRVNVSELQNDVGYITISDVPVYEAGTGLKKQNNTFSLTAAIPSAVSELVNDTGFITGYNAGSGISIVDGTINCTVSGGGGGGATYTAGEGIGISDQNVISLTATIPTIPTNISYFTNDVGYITNAALTNYATTAQLNSVSAAIPTSASQLINDGVYINNLIGANGVTVERSGFQEPYGREWFIRGKYVDIVASGGLSSYVYDDYGEKTLYLGIDDSVLTCFATTGQLNTVSAAIPTNTSQLINDSGFLTEVPVSNKELIYVDPYTYGSGEGVRYVSGYNIISTEVYLGGFDDVQPHPVSGATLDNGEVITFEHWMHSGSSIAKISIDPNDNQIVIGDIPSELPANTHTVVFTRRILKVNNTTQQFISYAYCF